MKNILFNSFANIDDDLLDMTAKKIKRAKPRKIALRVTGLVAIAATCVFAVNFGLSFVNKNKLPVQSEGSLSSTSSSGVNYSENEKYFEPYQGKEFVIDYDNLPFKCNFGELTKLNPDPIVNYTGIGPLRFLAYDISEYIGNNPWNENLEITEMPVFQTIDQDSRTISFNEKLENYKENGEIESEELQRLAEKYSEKLGFDDYEISVNSLYRLSDEGLVKEWINSIYPSSENFFEAILNSNFRRVSFYYTEELMPYTLKISYNDRLNSLECIGFYPIISAEEAREKLISDPHNYFGNPISEDFFKDGKNVDKIKHVELGYAGAVDGKSLPYYVFYIEDTEDYDDLPEGINHYITALYPAISPEYLMDRTEQNPVEGNENSSSTEQKAFYDDTFVGMALQGSGPRTTYEEVMDSLTSQGAKDRGVYIDSFYLVETVQALSIEGYEWDSSDSTIYEVKIIKDLISGEDINRTEKILLSNGTPKWQYEYDPAYAPGERFTVALGKPKEGKDYIEAPGSYMFKYDVPSDGSGYIYSRVSEMDKLNLPTSINIKETVVTSTTQNPAGYTQKVTLDAVVEFLRSDWKARVVSKHFDGTTS